MSEKYQTSNSSNYGQQRPQNVEKQHSASKYTQSYYYPTNVTKDANGNNNYEKCNFCEEVFGKLPGYDHKKMGCYLP